MCSYEPLSSASKSSSATTLKSTRKEALIWTLEGCCLHNTLSLWSFARIFNTFSAAKLPVFPLIKTGELPQNSTSSGSLKRKEGSCLFYTANTHWQSSPCSQLCGFFQVQRMAEIGETKACKQGSLTKAVAPPLLVALSTNIASKQS